MTSMISYNSDWTIFFRRPVSACILALALITLFFPLVRHLAAQRRHRAARASAAASD